MKHLEGTTEDPAKSNANIRRWRMEGAIKNLCAEYSDCGYYTGDLIEHLDVHYFIEITDEQVRPILRSMAARGVLHPKAVLDMND